MRDLDGWLAHISAQHWQTIDMGLSRMQKMVAKLGVERPAAKVITVAGTNGKGSTCVACEALLLEEGVRVGTTLSPHISRFNERIRIDGIEADDELICAAFTAVDAQRGDTPLTYFEYSALAALWCFKKCNVDVAILEIGLGGRLDAFNVVPADVAVITSIGLDHQQFLGDNRMQIGTEKAGIFRAGQAVALGVDMPETVLAACDSLALAPQIVGVDYRLDVDGSPGCWSIYQGDHAVLSELPFGQCAPHNLLLAYMAVNQLHPMAVSVLAKIARQIHMPGRLQRVLREGRQWLLDVAHNPAGAQFLAEQLQMQGIQPKLIVCAMLADKDHLGVYQAISEHFAVPWLLLDSEGDRALSAEQLAAALPASPQIGVSTWTELDAEVDNASQPGDVILAFGSFSMIEQFEQRNFEHDTWVRDRTS